MNICSVKAYDVVNGPGIRHSVWVAGCNIHCNDCFNIEAQSFDIGEPWKRVMDRTKKYWVGSHINGLSILGGEPLDYRNFDATVDLCLYFKEACPDKNIMIWTGYDIQTCSGSFFKKDFSQGHDWIDNIDILMQVADWIVYGPYISSKRTLTEWYGSTNQRILDCRKSLEHKEIINTSRELIMEELDL